MSDSADSLTQYVTISATSNFEDDDEALEALVQLKEIDLDDVFSDRDTQLDAEDGDGISIIFSHDEPYSQLQLQTNSESDVDISLSLSGDHVNSSPYILGKLLDNVGPITIDRVILFKDFKYAYQSLDLPIDEDTEIDITGVKVQEGSTSYIVQKTDEGDISVSATREVGKELEDIPSSNIGIGDLEQASEFIEGLL